MTASVNWDEIMNKARHLALDSGTFTDDPAEKADDVYLVNDIQDVINAFAKDIEEGKLGSYNEPAEFLDKHDIEKGGKKMLKTTVVIIEVGEDYTERLQTLSLQLPADEAAAIDAAAEHVAGLGYTVLADSCEYVSTFYPGEDYIAITVDGPKRA